MIPVHAENRAQLEQTDGITEIALSDCTQCLNRRVGTAKSQFDLQHLNVMSCTYRTAGDFLQVLHCLSFLKKIIKCYW